MPCSGTLTGRILANRSSSLRIATLADSTLGHGSPARGVVVGPFKITLQAFSWASTSSGMALLQAARFSMVRPSISLNWILPLATSSFSRKDSTRSLSLVMTGPIPSPPQIPITMVSSASKSVKSLSSRILLARASWLSIRERNCSTAASMACFSSVITVLQSVKLLIYCSLWCSPADRRTAAWRADGQTGGWRPGGIPHSWSGSSVPPGCCSP